MSRVIQDSDEEDDFTAPPPIAGETGDATSDHLPVSLGLITNPDITTAAPVVDHQVHGAEMRGTSSSEKLRRDIRAAHTALFEPTPSRSASASDKQQRTADDFEVGLEHAGIVYGSNQDSIHLKRARTTGSVLNTYAGKKRREVEASKAKERASNVWDVPSSAHGEEQQDGYDELQDDPLIRSSNTKRRRISRKASQPVPGGDVLQQEANDDERLPPVTLMTTDNACSVKKYQGQSTSSLELDDTFAAHNPSTLFPDSSNTMASGISPPETSSRTPITEHFKSPANPSKMHCGGRASPTTIEGSTCASLVIPQDQQISTQSQLGEAQELTLPTPSVRAPDVIVSIDTLHPGAIVESHQEHRSIKRKRISSGPNQSDQNNLEIEKQPEDSMNNLDTHLGQNLVVNESKSGNKKQKTTHELLSNTQSDELVIGLPLEMYQPRPSRSRGVKIVDNSAVDLPINPAKKKSKGNLRRRQTTGAISAYSSSLREMGFRSSQVEQALTAADGDFDTAFEWLTSRHNTTFGTHEKNAHHEDGNTVEAVDDFPATREEENEDHDDVVSNTATRAKEDQSTKGRHGRPKKQGSLPVVDDNPQQDLEMITETATIPECSTRKEIVREKKTRGRPRKVAQPIVELEIVEDDESQDETVDTTELTITIPQGKRPRTLAHVDANRNTESPQSKDTLQLDCMNDNVPSATPNQATSNMEAEAAQLPDKTMERSPSTNTKKTHSPINKGKITFKVGLSRRAKIEPLLRIIRK